MTSCRTPSFRFLSIWARVVAVVGVDERVVEVAEDKGDPKHAGKHPEDDLAGGLPGVDGAAKLQGHDERDAPAEEDYETKPFELGQLLERGQGRRKYQRGQDENHGGGHQDVEEEVDVEAPSLADRAFRKCTTDNRTQHRAQTPDRSHERNVDGPLFGRGDDAEKGHAADVHAAPSDPRNGPPHDEGVHGGGSTGDGTADLKERHVGELQPLDVEERVGLGPEDHEGRRGQDKGGAQPGELLELAHRADDVRLNVRDLCRAREANLSLTVNPIQNN